MKTLYDFRTTEEDKDDNFDYSDWSGCLYVDGNNTHNIDNLETINSELEDVIHVKSINFETKTLVLTLNILK